MGKGSLTVVSTGIQSYSHLTDSVRAVLKEADIVFFVSGDPLADRMLRELNPNLHSMLELYGPGVHRLKTYKRMAERIMEAVRSGQRTCAAFYGHAGVFAITPHVVIRMAREEGFSAEMLPGISAEDCLIADLNFDPATNGLQSYEATEFLLRSKRPDVTAALVLWQIAFIGTSTAPGAHVRRENLAILGEVLSGFYGPSHQSIIYEAASLAGFEPVRTPVALSKLHLAQVSNISTLYVPPLAIGAIDHTMEARLGIVSQDIAACLR